MLKIQEKRRSWKDWDDGPMPFPGKQENKNSKEFYRYVANCVEKITKDDSRAGANCDLQTGTSCPESLRPDLIKKIKKQN